MRKNKWTITTGYDTGKAYLDLWASGDRLTEADCIHIASSLLNHVQGLRLDRRAARRARKVV
jgi:hypothetical protein